MSLSVVELLGLGEALPARWRLVTDTRRDLEWVEPLLYRDVVHVNRVREEFQRHFLLPLEWLSTQHCLVVVRCVAEGSAPVSEERLRLPAHLLHFFRLFQVVEGIRVPQAMPEPPVRVPTWRDLDCPDLVSQ